MTAWSAACSISRLVLPVLALEAGELAAQDVVQAPQPGDSVAIVRPPLHVYLDSAALHAALRHVPAAAAAKRTAKRTAHVFLVRFDSTGSPEVPVPAVPMVMPASYRDAVTPLLRSALRAIPPRRTGWSTLLHVEAGEAPRIAAVELPQRAPSLANAGAIGERLYDAAQRMMREDEALIGTAAHLRLALRIDEDGRVTSSSLARSSGNPKVDAAALAVVPLMRFHPALVDGERAPASALLPFRFVFSPD